MKIETICPICHEHDVIDLTDDEFKQYLAWRNRELLIQDALPNKTPHEREQLKTGICPHCWDEMFKQEEEA